MAANAASGYVVPIGSDLGSAIVGGPLNGPNGYPQAAQGMFNIYGPNGQVDPRGAFAAPTDAWNAGRLGYATIGAPDVLNAAAQEAQNRYLGDPSTGAGGWDQRWNQWNSTDVPGGTAANPGNTLLSPVHQTGLRISQNYGGFDQNGNPVSAINSQPNQGFTYMQNLLSQNPDLQTGNILSGYNQQMQNSPYSAPGLAAYMSAIQPANGVGAMANITNNDMQAMGSLGRNANFDQYGQRGINQTNALDTANLNQLTGNIDTAAQQSLANQLQSTQQSMEAAGLGRSGAGQMAMLQNQAQILAQANRDKQSTLADFTNQNANRGAQAINLATQQGYGGLGQTFGANANALTQAMGLSGQAQNQWSNLQGNAAMQGLQGQQQFNQIGQQGLSNLYGQTMANANQRYGVDTGNYLQSLQGSQGLLNQQMQMQGNQQSQALNDWLNLQNNRNQTQQNSANQAITLADAQRSIQQDRLNQMMQYASQPYNNMMTIATGTQPNAAPISPPNFWQNQLAQGAGAGVGSFLAGNGTAQNPGFLNTLWNGAIG